MKKTVLSMIMMLVLLSGAAQGQIPYPPSTDTLPCGERQRDYYYSEWYDTLDIYLRPDGYSYTSPSFPGDFVILGEFGGDKEHRWAQQFAGRRIRIKGLWAMVKQYGPPSNYVIRDSTRLPEYLYLGLRVKEWPSSSYSTYNFLECMDSVRWDTAQPKMMCVKQTADGRKRNLYCHVYEALFDTVYTLSGEFWIGGSGYSNVRKPSEPFNVLEHWPTVYAEHSRYPSLLTNPSMPYSHTCSSRGLDGVWSSYENMHSYSSFGVILDEPQYYVELPSSDTVRGIAKPTAYYPAGTRQTITAVANHCYRFSHWSDGDSTNPRTILVTQDTTFTAYFDTAEAYSVAARSNDNAKGRAVLREWPIRPVEPPFDTVRPNYDSLYFPFYRVIGSDTVYCEGDSAIFWAKPRAGYYFWYWNDSVRDNPRTLIVTQDTVLTAIFKRENPPAYVRPCPRIHKPRLVVVDTGRVLLTWAWEADVLHTGWELAWGLSGMPPESCNVVSCGTFERAVDTLEAGVRYVAYVRGLCSESGVPYYSDWSDSVEIYFPEFPNRYTVTVSANYAERGRVYGGGEYDEGALAMLTASAWSPYSFLQWDDGEVENPRYVVVTQDMSFMALFTEPEPPIEEGIATADGLKGRLLLQPNPAREEVRCVLNGCAEAGGVLTVADVAGREVLRKELPKQTQSYTFRVAELPAGTYFVTLVTKEGTATRRLVVE